MLHDGILLLTLLLKVAIAGLLLLAASRDVMTRTIENWVPLTLAAVCTTLAMAESRLLWGLVFGAIVFIVCVICWKRGWMGGADVKLLGYVDGFDPDDTHRPRDERSIVPLGFLAPHGDALEPLQLAVQLLETGSQPI